MEPHDKPAFVTTEDGHVIMDGPGHVAVTLTADAAMTTAKRLEDAGLQAHSHRFRERR